MVQMASRVSELDRLRRALAPPTSHAEFVELPMADFLMIDGRGSPESEEFRDAVHALFTMDTALRLLVQDGVSLPEQAMPLEVVWGAVETDAETSGGAEDWSWTAMVAQPARITPALVNALRDRLRERERLPLLDRVRLGSLREGRCAQITHVGPFATEAETLGRLRQDIVARGYEAFGPQHEIYLGNPDDPQPERMRTVLRIPVHAAA